RGQQDMNPRIAGPENQISHLLHRDERSGDRRPQPDDEQQRETNLKDEERRGPDDEVTAQRGNRPDRKNTAGHQSHYQQTGARQPGRKCRKQTTQSTLGGEYVHSGTGGRPERVERSLFWVRSAKSETPRWRTNLFVGRGSRNDQLDFGSTAKATPYRKL